MARFFKCLSLTLLIFIGYTFAYNRRVFRDFKQKQKEYSIISSNYTGQGQDNNIICQSARCDYKSNTIYNVTNPECGNHYTCQECPPSLGTDICYLGLTSPDWVNITEGHVTLTKHDRVFKQTKKEAPSPKNDYEDDYDEDEDSFIETDSMFSSPLGTSFVQKFSATQTFTYVDHHNDKSLLENKKQCQVDKDGNVELSVRLIFQYFRSPLESSFADQGQGEEGYEGQSHLQLDQLSNSSINVGKVVVKNDQIAPSESNKDGNNNDGISMLELGFFGGRGGDDDDDDDDGGFDSGNVFSSVAKKGFRFSMNKGSALKNKVSNAVKFLYQKAQVMMAKPEIHFHFVVDDIRIKNCRQPLSWSGEMNANALIFVGNQNFKLNYDALTVEFLRKGVRVNTSVTGIYELSFNSCLQVHCTKKPPTRLQYLVSPLTPRSTSFNISRKLMGLANMGVPDPHQHFVLTAPNTNTNPNMSGFNATVGLHLPSSTAQSLSTPNSFNQTVLSTNSGQLNGLYSNGQNASTTSTGTSQLTSTSSSSTGTSTTVSNNTNGVSNSSSTNKTSTTTQNTNNQSLPNTNLPGFNTPVNQPTQDQHSVTTLMGSLVKAEGNKTRFWVFMGVGILIILFLGYFFFLRH